MNNQYILLICMIILGCTCLTIIVSEFKEPENIIGQFKINESSELKQSGTLKYAFYNYTTEQVTYKDSGIPIYNK